MTSKKINYKETESLEAQVATNQLHVIDIKVMPRPGISSPCLAPTTFANSTYSIARKSIETVLFLSFNTATHLLRDGSSLRKAKS